MRESLASPESYARSVPRATLFLRRRGIPGSLEAQLCSARYLQYRAQTAIYRTQRAIFASGTKSTCRKQIVLVTGSTH